MWKRLLLALALFPAAMRAGELPLIPAPALLKAGPAGFIVAGGTPLVVPPGDAQARFAADWLATRVERERGLTLAVQEGTGEGGAIRFALDSAIAHDEGYVLDVSPAAIRLTAHDGAGLLHGAATLAQMLVPDGARDTPVALPGIHVEDWPRFAWRGLLLDVARHFQPVSEIRLLLDEMAARKLDVLHLHLTDDQGWRLEIKRYPDLTRIGAWRRPPTLDGAPSDRLYGGFYTQEEMRGLVAYAADRHITIVPEIDMPGHAQAAMASYPEIGVTGDRPPVSHDWGVNPYLYNVDEAGFTFIRNVLDEVMALFPSAFIHVGGDEAVKDQWRASAKVQQRMRDLGLADENDLQSWFIEQVGLYLAAHGRRMIGWDEILEGGLPPTASVMSWRGVKGAIEAARLGHDVVLSPAPTLYLDDLQSDRGDEPAGRLAIVPLSAVYGYEPVPPELDAAQAAHVLGAQANVWSEYLATPAQVNRAVFPRLDAFAEIAWSPREARDWNGFLTRLPAQIQRERRLGIETADSAFAIAFDRQGNGAIGLSNQAGAGLIRYTLDGSDPTAASPLYRTPLRVAKSVRLRAAAFTESGEALSAARENATDRVELQACPGEELGLRVPLDPDGASPQPVYDVNLEDGCWIYPRARLDGGRTLTAQLGWLPRNYGLAHDADKVKARRAKTAYGEMELHRDGCSGPLLASFALPSPLRQHRPIMKVTLPAAGGTHDLCLLATTMTDHPASEPAMIAVERVRLN